MPRDIPESHAQKVRRQIAELIEARKHGEMCEVAYLQENCTTLYKMICEHNFVQYSTQDNINNVIKLLFNPEKYSSSLETSLWFPNGPSTYAGVDQTVFANEAQIEYEGDREYLRENCEILHDRVVALAFTKSLNHAFERRIDFMLANLDLVEENVVSQYDASVKVGQEVADQYFPRN